MLQNALRRAASALHAWRKAPGPWSRWMIGKALFNAADPVAQKGSELMENALADVEAERSDHIASNLRQITPDGRRRIREISAALDGR